MCKVTIHCDAILCHNEITLDVPEWTSPFDDKSGGSDYGGDGRWVFCPDHRDQFEWFDSVCPGCVESYPDCKLSRAFAYSHDRDISDDRLAAIESGRCPFRANGSMIYNSGTGISMRVDISSQAPTAAGKAIADAIREYIAKYPEETQ